MQSNLVRVIDQPTESAALVAADLIPMADRKITAAGVTPHTKANITAKTGDASSHLQVDGDHSASGTSKPHRIAVHKDRNASSPHPTAITNNGIVNPRPLDLSICNRDPIRTPGTVQPQGVLLVLGPVLKNVRGEVVWRPDYVATSVHLPRSTITAPSTLHFEVVAVSENSHAVMGASPVDLLHAPLSRFFSPLVATALRTHFQRTLVKRHGLDTANGSSSAAVSLPLDQVRRSFSCDIEDIASYFNSQSSDGIDGIPPVNPAAARALQQAVERLLNVSVEVKIDLHDGNVDRPGFFTISTTLPSGAEVDVYSHTWKGMCIVEIMLTRESARPIASSSPLPFKFEASATQTAAEETFLNSAGTAATAVPAAGQSHELRVSSSPCADPSSASTITPRSGWAPCCAEPGDIEEFEKYKAARSSELALRLAQLELKIQSAHNVNQCASLVTEYCAGLTGFDRVLLYR